MVESHHRSEPSPFQKIGAVEQRAPASPLNWSCRENCVENAFAGTSSSLEICGAEVAAFRVLLVLDLDQDAAAVGLALTGRERMMDPTRYTPPRAAFWMRLALLVCFIVSLAAVASATTVIIPTDDQLIISSRAVVRARVIFQACGFDSRRDIVYTYVTLRIREALKGEIGSRDIVLKEPGGQVGNRGSVFFGSPRFASGEDVILYLDTWPDGSLRVHDMFMGKFTVLRDEQSGQLFAVRGQSGPNVEIIPQNRSDGNDTQRAESTSRMELSAYLRMIRKKIASTAEQSSEFGKQYFRDQKMLAEPRDYQSLAHSGGLEPQFHLLYNGRWFEPDSGHAVTYLINPDQVLNPQVAADLDAAMRAWSTVPGCSLRVVDGGTATTCTIDGFSVVDFDNCKGLFASAGGCQSILAESGFDFDPYQTRVVNGTTFTRIVDGYLSLNPYAACYFGDHCNLQEVLTHEMGHSLGMGHSWDSAFGGSPTPDERAATMYYQIHFDGRCASLRDDDMNGIRFIYPGSGGSGPGPLSANNPPLPMGITGTPYNQTLSASGGLPPYVWSLTSGSLPPGLNVQPGTAAISGSPSEAGSFNFSVVVSDSASPKATVVLNLNILVATPESLPHISTVKYKSGSLKLVIYGENFDPAARVLVDAAPDTIRSNTPTQLVVKGLSLASGTHTVTVVNPNGVPPATVSLTVN